MNKVLLGISTAVLGISISLGIAYLTGTSRAADEDWTDSARTRCEAKQGYLIFLHKANAPTEEVLCVPVIFREKAP